MRVRQGVALFSVCFASLALLAVAACSGGYPLPPTRCDEFCDATKGLMCDEYYEPAGCVLSCEQGDMDNAACSLEMDAAIACYKNTPGAAHGHCTWNGQPQPCDTEGLLLTNCVGTQHFLRSTEGVNSR